MRVLLIMGLLLVGTIGYAQSVKGYSYQYKDADLKEIHLDLKGGEIEVKHWPHSTIFIETHIYSGNVSPKIISNLAKTDRYTIYGEAKGSILNVYSEVKKEELTINGNPFKETITYRVYVPKGMVVIHKGKRPK